MSSPMIPWKPVVNTANRLLRYLTSSTDTPLWISLPTVPIHDVETLSDRSARKLKHLLKANHINNALLYNKLRFHNHVPHALGSAYLLGCDAAHLERYYSSELEQLGPWKDSPDEITGNWRERLGDRRYYHAYGDYFEDELALKFGYDWKILLDEYMYSGKEPLINGVIGDIGHPLIHLAYAYELNSREVAMEAVTMTASTYTFLHKYLDDVSYSRCSPYSDASPLSILHKIHHDDRFSNIVTSPGSGDLTNLFKHHEALLLEHWNAWKIENPISQFQASQQVAVSLLVHTVEQGPSCQYDFFLVHLLTSSHAIRVLLPLLPKKLHVPLIRQWFLLVISIYVSQMRPKISEEVLEKPVKDWKYVDEKALKGPWAFDAHYVKALRAMKVAASTWGDEGNWYLASAIRYADSFNGWTGWGAASENH